MKAYTEQDLQPWAGSSGISVDNHRTDLVSHPLAWQKLGLQQTATGYGSKLVTEWMISYCGKLYRVYATCYSNAASHWFVAKGRKIFIH